MSDDDDGAAAEPIEVPLLGDGPFQLPVCSDLAEIALGEAIAILRFETLDAQRVDIPVPIGMLVEIKEAVEEALQTALAQRDGTRLQ